MKQTILHNYGNIALLTQYGRIPFFKPMQTVDGDTSLSGAMYKENVLKAMFSLSPSDISDPLVVDDNIAVVKALDKRTASDEETSGVRLYYPYLAASLRQEELSRMFLYSEKLKDNFYSVFRRDFLLQNGQSSSDCETDRASCSDKGRLYLPET